MEALIKLFGRDLRKLKLEIENFTNESDLWEVNGEISNSAGNLCLHIVGNLNHFIGNIIGGNGFIRDRENEFNRKNIGRGKLIKMVEDTQDTVSKALQHFDSSDLIKIYPIQFFGEDMTYEFFLVHLYGHLNYHLGQINYLRRILEY